VFFWDFTVTMDRELTRFAITMAREWLVKTAM